MYFLIVLETGSPKSRQWQSSSFLRPLFLAYTWPSSPCVLKGLPTVCVYVVTFSVKCFLKCITYFLAVLSLYCFTGFSLVVGSRGYSLAVVRGLLIAMPSLILELSSALGCVGFSRYSAWAQYLWLLGSRAQASIVVTHGVSYARACGIFPDQGSNPRPLHWQMDSLPLSYQGNPANLLFKKIKKKTFFGCVRSQLT